MGMPGNEMVPSFSVFLINRSLRTTDVYVELGQARGVGASPRQTSYDFFGYRAVSIVIYITIIQQIINLYLFFFFW